MNSSQWTYKKMFPLPILAYLWTELFFLLFFLLISLNFVWENKSMTVSPVFT